MNQELKNLQRYNDPTGELSNRQLLFSEWYVKHRLLLEKIGLNTIIVFCVIIWGFSLWKWGDYFIFGYVADEQMAYDILAETPNYTATQVLYRAQDLQFSRPEVFAGGVGRYDFVADVFNPNTRWAAKVTYKFVFGGNETESQETIIMPLAKRPVAIFGHVADSFPGNMELTVEKVEWRKIDPHVLPVVKDYVDQRLTFGVENFVFMPAQASTGLVAHHTSFDLFNDTVYSYWSPQFYVELMGGLEERRIGLIPLTLEEFKAGSSEHVDLSSLSVELDVSDVRVYPLINVFNGNEFMMPGE